MRQRRAQHISLLYGWLSCFVTSYAFLLCGVYLFGVIYITADFPWVEEIFTTRDRGGSGLRTEADSLHVDAVREILQFYFYVRECMQVLSPTD